MKETLFLLHTALDVIKMHKALQTAGMCFRVADIPRELHGGYGLCTYISYVVGKGDEWVILGHTESIYHLESGDWRCLATFPPS